MNPTELPLAPLPPAGALERKPPTVADILQAVVAGGVTAENVSAVKEVVALYERMQDRDAEKAFAAAFVALQAEMPKVQAIRAVPNNDGSVRYRFAPYEEIMRQVSPMLLKHGFTVTFSTRYEEARLVKVCTLQHTAGHKKSNEFAVRIGKGPPAASETQADGAASTYAKRGALCDALNIVVEHDDDARAEGATIFPEQAEEFRRRVQATGSDERAFLRVAGAASYGAIPSARYDILDELLAKRERLQAQKLTKV